MTAHVQHPVAQDDRNGQESEATAPAPPWWLLPGVLVATVAAALVVAGVVSLSTVLYAGLFGAMILMHAGGHGGHGGHGGQAGSGSQSGHGAGASRDEDLSQPSPDSQPGESRSASGLADRASDEPNGSETHDHDQRSAHSCH